MKRRFLVVAASLLVAAVLAWGGTAWADQSGAQIDPSVQTELSAVGSGGSVPVIVYATPGHLADLTAEIGAANVDESLALIGAVSTDVTSDTVATVAALPYADYIAADTPTFGTDDGDYGKTLDVTNAAIGLGDILPPPPVANGYDGTGVGVAVLDSGSADVPDLDGANGQSRVVAFVDFVNGRRHMYDDGGHGTFVDGIIAGNGESSLPFDQGGPATTQYRGVAPDANIISLKVLDRHGNGRASALIAAIAWAIAHRQQYDIRVMNISVEGDVTCPAAYDPVDRAVDAAWKAGIVVVCAAGNEGAFGEGGILSPGNDPYAITVGASDTQQTDTTSDDAVCSYSSIGPTLYDEYAKPDLVAPGNHIVSLRAPGSWVDTTYPQTRVSVSTYIPGASPWTPSVYAVMSGTSAAAPVVSGAAALLIQQDPSLTPGDVKLRLMQTAQRIATSDQYAEGAGELDVAAALSDDATTTGYDLSAKLGNGSTILPIDVQLQWQKYAWSKYAWSKYAWSKYAWSKYAWSKYAWSNYAWSKYAWSIVINGE
jgi:serine protease AprX